MIHEIFPSPDVRSGHDNDVNGELLFFKHVYLVD